MKNNNVIKNKQNGIHKQVPRGNGKEEAEKDSRMEETAAYLRGCIEKAKSERKISGGNGKLTLLEQRDIENDTAYQFAKKNNLWIDNQFDLGYPFSSGTENNNYLNLTNQKLYKVNNLMNSNTMENLFIQVKLHNEFFPEVRYTFEGFTGVSWGNGQTPIVNVIFSQDLITDGMPADYNEIDTYMSRLGFIKIADVEYEKNGVLVADMHPRNVLKDEQNDIYVIDNIIRKNDT